MIYGKTAEYNLFWIRNEKNLGRVRTFLTKTWVMLSLVRDRMIIIELLGQEVIISVMSPYSPKYGLDDSQKDNFSDSPINIVKKIRGRKLWS